MLYSIFSLTTEKVNFWININLLSINNASKIKNNITIFIWLITIHKNLSRFNFHLLFWSLEIFYSVKVSLYLLWWQLGKGFVLTYNSNLNTVSFYLSFITCWLLQGTKSMENQFFWSWSLEFIKLVFEISSCRLGSCSNWIGIEFIVVSWRASFK